MEQIKRDLNDMAVFAAIVSAGGLSAAAKRIGLPKSNVSRRLARLEARLGVQLIERNTRVSRLTPVGKCYADYCRQMVEDAAAADDVIAASLARPSGTLRVTASVLVGQQVISPALSDYAKEFSDVTVSMSLTNHRVSLIEDGFDLAFRIGRGEDSSLISQALGIFPMRLYASAEYLTANGIPASPDDLLADHACLFMSSVDNVPNWRLTDDAGAGFEADLSPRIVINDFISLRRLVLDGVGIGLFPDYVVHHEVETGRLRPILENWRGPKSELSALYPSRRGATLKVRAFIDCVRRRVGSVSQS